MSAFEPTAPKTTANEPAMLPLSRVTAVAGALLVLLTVNACASTPTAQDIAGMWSSSATVTQRGSTSETFCFANDGSLEWTSQAPSGTTRHLGTYKLAGNVLTLKADDIDEPVNLKASMSLGKLELTSPSGSKQRYSRVPGACEGRKK